MRSQSRGRAIGADVVSYRRRSIEPTAQPVRKPVGNAYHAADCTCPHCEAQRSDDEPPPAAA
jgi:hypothetical protein